MFRLFLCVVSFNKFLCWFFLLCIFLAIFLILGTWKRTVSGLNLPLSILLTAIVWRFFYSLWTPIWCLTNQFWCYLLGVKGSVGLPRGSDSKESACTAGYPGSSPGLGRAPGGGNGYPTPVFLPGESHGFSTVHGVAKSWTHLSYWHFRCFFFFPHKGSVAQDSTLPSHFLPPIHTYFRHQW